MARARTARQRAALRKAQLISARKRRRRRLTTGLKVVGTAVGAAAAYRANYYLNNPREAVRDYKDVKGAITKVKNRKKAPPVSALKQKRKPINPYRLAPRAGALRSARTGRRLR